jgi:hypothetical protein
VHFFDDFMNGGGERGDEKIEKLFLLEERRRERGFLTALIIQSLLKS